MENLLNILKRKSQYPHFKTKILFSSGILSFSTRASQFLLLLIQSISSRRHPNFKLASDVMSQIYQSLLAGKSIDFDFAVVGICNLFCADIRRFVVQWCQIYCSQQSAQWLDLITLTGSLYESFGLNPKCICNSIFSVNKH